jgi:hypothetical protein
LTDLRTGYKLEESKERGSTCGTATESHGPDQVDVRPNITRGGTEKVTEREPGRLTKRESDAYFQALDNVLAAEPGSDEYITELARMVEISTHGA